MKRPLRKIGLEVPERHIERETEEIGDDPEDVRESENTPDPWDGQVDDVGDDPPPEIEVRLTGKAVDLARFFRRLFRG